MSLKYQNATASGRRQRSESVTAIRSNYKERRDGPWGRDGPAWRGTAAAASWRECLHDSRVTCYSDQIYVAILVASPYCRTVGESSFIFWLKIVPQGEHRGERAMVGGTRPSLHGHGCLSGASEGIIAIQGINERYLRCTAGPYKSRCCVVL